MNMNKRRRNQPGSRLEVEWRGLGDLPGHLAVGEGVERGEGLQFRARVAGRMPPREARHLGGGRTVGHGTGGVELRVEELLLVLQSPLL